MYVCSYPSISVVFVIFITMQNEKQRKKREQKTNSNLIARNFDDVHNLIDIKIASKPKFKCSIHFHAENNFICLATFNIIALNVGFIYYYILLAFIIS